MQPFTDTPAPLRGLNSKKKERGNIKRQGWEREETGGKGEWIE